MPNREHSVFALRNGGAPIGATALGNFSGANAGVRGAEIPPHPNVTSPGADTGL